MQKQQPRTSWFRGVRPASSFRHIFFLFLIGGPFVILPYMVLMPTETCLRSAWRKQPRVAWRLAVCISIVLGFAFALPGSPVFVGLNAPIPLDAFPPQTGHFPTPVSLLRSQLAFVNAALVFTMVCFPLTAASTFATVATRRRANSA